MGKLFDQIYNTKRKFLEQEGWQPETLIIWDKFIPLLKEEIDAKDSKSIYTIIGLKVITTHKTGVLEVY